MAIDYTMIGKRLKESRMAAKLTQEKVAEAADITTVYLSKIENGKVTPTLDTLGAVCAAVNADLGYVVSGCQYSQCCATPAAKASRDIVRTTRAPTP